tara:strand:- start:2179 stop:2532 length:354 start_codon:yes stop_codon:yes gene_type:complete
MDTDTPIIQPAPTIRRRRHHTLAFKQQVIAESNAPGASVAGVAIRHSLNPNLVQKWRRTVQPAPQNDFVQLPAPISAPTIAPTTVRIEVPMPKGTLVVHWPISELPQAVAWLRALTR